MCWVYLELELDDVEQAYDEDAFWLRHVPESTERGFSKFFASIINRAVEQMAPGTSAFTRYPDLPFELRLRIWEYAEENQAREVHVQIIQCPQLKFKLLSPFPATLHACSTSREKAMRIYKPCFTMQDSRRRTIYINPSVDTLFIHIPWKVKMIEQDGEECFTQTPWKLGDGSQVIESGFFRTGVRDLYSGYHAPWKTWEDRVSFGLIYHCHGLTAFFGKNYNERGRDIKLHNALPEWLEAGIQRWDETPYQATMLIGIAGFPHERCWENELDRVAVEL